MTEDFREYLGAIELTVDGFQYEIRLRKEADRGIRVLWTCITCARTTPTVELKAIEGDAIELAKLELTGHHDGRHRTQSVKTPRQSR